MQHVESPDSAEIRAYFANALATIDPAARQGPLAGALWGLAPWHGAADLIATGAALRFDTTLCPRPPTGADEVIGLLAFARALIALREHGAAEEILSDLGRGTTPTPLHVDALRVALLMRATLHGGRAGPAMAWANLTELPSSELASDEAHSGAEIALTLGLCRMVAGDFGGATAAFDRALTLAGRHAQGEVALVQSWLALIGQTQAAVRAGEFRLAAELADTAISAADAAEARWEAAMATLFRDACRVVAGDDPDLSDLKHHASVFARGPTPGAPVDLFHGLPIEPPTRDGGTGAPFAAALIAAIPERIRGLDRTAIALMGAAAACLFECNGQPEAASAAIAHATAGLATLGREA